MPARPWPDGSAGWRRGLASRLRGLAERLDPGRPAGQGSSLPGASPVAAPGTGLEAGGPTAARGFDLSGAPEHWVRLLRDAGLAPAGASADDAAIVEMPTVVPPTVRGNFGLSLLRKSRLWPTTARMPSGAAEPKSPTTAAPRHETQTQDTGILPEASDAPSDAPGTVAASLAGPALRSFAPLKDAERASQRGGRAVPVLRLRPDRGKPASPPPSQAASEPRKSAQRVRHALRPLTRENDAEQAPQRNADGVPVLRLRPQSLRPQRLRPQTPAQPRPAAPTQSTQSGHPTSGHPTSKHPTSERSAAVEASRVARPELPREPAKPAQGPTPKSSTPKSPSVPKPQGHPSSAGVPAPKPALSGEWPELALKPGPPPQASHSSEPLEHALARAARLNQERSAV